MKLRNKKSGEIMYLLFNSYPVSGEIVLEYMDENAKSGYSEYCRYSSLAQLNEEWEDYTPPEPLIKDEKIRKAVRAWAEANNRDSFKVINEHFNCCKIIGYTDGGDNSCDKIEFGTTITHAKKDYFYTIAELCGEEEE